MIKLNTGDTWEPSEDDLALWLKTYPAVNVSQELMQMGAWCDANPTRRKTKSGVKRFVTSWLSRAQDKGGSPMARKAGGYGGMRAMTIQDERTDVSWLSGAVKEAMKLRYLNDHGRYWDGQTVHAQEKTV